MRRVVRSCMGLAAGAILGVLAAPGIGAQAPAAKKAPPSPPQVVMKHTMTTPDQMKWGPAPPALPAGAQLAVLDGDPGKAGLFVIRAKFPDGYKVPPHWHPTDEHVVIVSGTLKAGSGNKWDDASMHTLGAGSYAKMARRMSHYVQAQGETVVQITAMGPFQVTYVNPNDDPRKKTN
jgi:hypothetical protein